MKKKSKPKPRRKSPTKRKPVDHWSATTISRRFRNKQTKGFEDRTESTLRYKGRAVHQLDGVLARAILESTAEKWNQEGYVPTTSSGKCIADLPPELRGKALKDMCRKSPPLPFET